MLKRTDVHPLRGSPLPAHPDPMANDAPNREPPLVLGEALSVAMAEMFRALADPTRARIVYALIHQEMTTSGLAELLTMSQPTISQHLRLLRMLRIVRPRRDGRLVFYSLDDAHIRLLVTLSLSHLRESDEGHARGGPTPVAGGLATASPALPPRAS